MPCFDVSGFYGLPDNVLNKYKYEWTTFERIFYNDIKVSTLRGTGNKSMTYYTYMTYAEQIAFTNGRLLHINRYPTSNWALPEKS